jgi:hypothetical protein
VLIYDPFPTATNELPSVVIGQSNFVYAVENDADQNGFADATPSARTLYSPSGVSLVGRRLLVADRSNGRVLVFNSQ